MDDKEVGELWHQHHKDMFKLAEGWFIGFVSTHPDKCYVCNLIRKLIEESARKDQAVIEGLTHDSVELVELIPNVLQRYGIDPATWINGVS